MYDRRTVEVLLSTLWDEASVWGVKREEFIDPMMPKAKANPAHGNTLAAMMADIQQAWSKCDIPNRERRVIVLRYGFDWTYEQIGYNQGVTKKAAQLRDERAVGRITAWLNGDNYDEDLPVLETAVQV